MELDIEANRRAKKWSRKELLGRVLWDVVHPFFRFSPRLAWGWRRWLLRCFGAKIGSNVCIFPTVKITIPWNLTIGDNSAVGDGAILYALGTIEIGRSTTVSQGAHLCAGTHDFRDGKMTLLKPPISIGDQVWICADAFIGPDVTVGDTSVVGARAVVMRDIEPDKIASGNPAVVTGSRSKPAPHQRNQEVPPA